MPAKKRGDGWDGAVRPSSSWGQHRQPFVHEGAELIEIITSTACGWDHGRETQMAKRGEGRGEAQITDLSEDAEMFSVGPPHET